MLLKLKAGAELTTDDNHLGLKMAQWWALQAGAAVEVESPSAALLEFVDIQDEEPDDGR